MFERTTSSGLARYHGAIFALIASLAALTLLSFSTPKPLLLTHSLLLNISITTAALVIALGVAYFALTEFLLYGSVDSLLVGLGFLLLAEANITTGLFPLLAGLHGEAPFAQTAWGAHILVGAALLVAAALARERVLPAADRKRWTVAASVTITVAAAAAGAWVNFSGVKAPHMFVQQSLQLGAAVLFFAACFLFWHAAGRTGRAWYAWLALNFSIGGFAQLQYAAHVFSPDYVQPGDVLRLVFFVGIFLALVGEWGRGFFTLRAQTRELEVLHALMNAPSIQRTGEVVQHITRVVGDSLRAVTHVMLSPESGPDSVTRYEIALESNGSDRESEGNLRNQPMLAAPLVARGRRIGTLTVRRTTRELFSQQDVHLLHAFAAQASVLLDRSLLYDEVAAGAVMQERSRLAREIHDGLAQHLAFLKMRVAWLQRSPAIVDTEQLRDIEGVLTTALTEARQAITTLRSDSGANASSAVVSYAEEFGRISGLSVTVHADDAVPDTGPRARVELLRVVQEALNNVRKHAGATQVDVSLLSCRNGIEVHVRDNGTGFAPQDTPAGHFGLEIMRERAESIGGTLALTSTPGSGTDVTIWVPAGTEDETVRQLIS